MYHLVSHIRMEECSYYSQRGELCEAAAKVSEWPTRCEGCRSSACACQCCNAAKACRYPMPLLAQLLSGWMPWSSIHCASCMNTVKYEAGEGEVGAWRWVGGGGQYGQIASMLPIALPEASLCLPFAPPSSLYAQTTPTVACVRRSTCNNTRNHQVSSHTYVMSRKPAWEA